MAIVERPNKEALTKAIDIYREHMRPFVTRCLRRLSDKPASEAIMEALDDHQSREFERNLKKVGDLESAIDVGIFPRLVHKYWQEVFSTEFDGDRSTIVKNLNRIKQARNLTSHPPFGRDLDGGKTREHLCQIKSILRSSGAKEGVIADEAVFAELEPASRTLVETAQRHGSRQSQADAEEKSMSWLTGAAIGVTALVAIASSVIAFIELDRTEFDE